METIRIETVLELVSADIWWEKKIYDQTRTDWPGIPSLRERMLLVEELLPLAVFDGRTVSFFKGAHAVSDLHEIPFFNYLMLASELVFTEDPEVTAHEWSITGFSSFEELDNFIQEHEFLCRFHIYVRHTDRYKKAHYRLAFQRPGEEKTYADEWGFYCADAELNDSDSRNPNYQYFFEITGLCELQCRDEICCFIFSSLDDLNGYLEGRACGCDLSWVRELGKITGYRFKESGSIRYEGETYTYRIEMDDQETGWNLYDKHGHPYCPMRHAFCTEGMTCCEESWEHNGDTT